MLGSRRPTDETQGDTRGTPSRSQLWMWPVAENQSHPHLSWKPFGWAYTAAAAAAAGVVEVALLEGGRLRVIASALVVQLVGVGVAVVVEGSVASFRVL